MERLYAGEVMTQNALRAQPAPEQTVTMQFSLSDYNTIGSGVSSLLAFLHGMVTADPRSEARRYVHVAAEVLNAFVYEQGES